MALLKNIRTFFRNAKDKAYHKTKKSNNDDKKLLLNKTENVSPVNKEIKTKKKPYVLQATQPSSEKQRTSVRKSTYLTDKTQKKNSVNLIDFRIEIKEDKKIINEISEKKEEIRKKIQERVDKARKKGSRKGELLYKWKHAAKEFGQASTKSNDIIAKEQQVSIDLDNKMLFDHQSNRVIKNPPMYETPAYIREVGTKERKGYKDSGYETIAKRFSSEEQKEHTRIPKLDKNSGKFRLYDQSGKLYDTSNETSKGTKGLVAYAVTLSGDLVTSPHIQPGKEVDFGYYHSTLLGGKPGLCFGMMKVKEGEITYIDDNSGHYKPIAENLYNAVKKLNDLFAADAVVSSYSLHIPYVNTEEIRYSKDIERVEQFLKRMEKKGQDGLTKPQRYFENMRKYNNEYKASLTYKPVPVFNDNAKIAVEHSIRKFIGADYGNKPTIDIDQSTSKITVSFKDKNLASQFSNKLRECGYECSRKKTSLGSGSDLHVIHSSKKHFYSFLSNELKIDPRDIEILKNQLTPKLNQSEQRTKNRRNSFEQRILKEKNQARVIEL